MRTLRVLLIAFGFLGIGLGAAEAGRLIQVGPHGDPQLHIPATGQRRLVFGVMGGSATNTPPKVTALMQRLGAAIAKAGHVTLTGAGTGLPQDAIVGAKNAGGFTMGVSPWRTRKQHIAEGDPLAEFDVMKFTSLPVVYRGKPGKNNFMGRALDNVEHSHAVIIAGGRNGTLEEFAIAMQENRPIGVLLGSGGISGDIRRLVTSMAKAGKIAKAPIIYDRNPERLVQRLEQIALGTQ